MKKALSTPYGKTKIYSYNEHLDPEHVLVVPGYSESNSHNNRLVDAIGEMGYDAFTFSPPRRKGPKKYRKNDPIERQGNIILGILEETVPKGEQVHAVAHSLGSAAVLKAAIARPERFASITLMQPVGMVGDQSFPELLGRTGKKVSKNQAGALRGQNPERKPKVGYAASVDKESAMRYSARVTRAQIVGGFVLAKQPVLALEEASASGQYDLADDVTRLQELGVQVNIVKSHNDELFDTNKVDSGYSGIAGSVESYSSVADRKARHDTFWMQPERTAAIVRQLIENS